MRHLASLALLLLTLLTGVALGHARGQVIADGGVVLCSGQALRVIPDSGAGAPVRHQVAFCPDMALSLMAALAACAPDVMPRTLAPRRADDSGMVCHVATLALTPPRARAPPAVSA